MFVTKNQVYLREKIKFYIYMPEELEKGNKFYQKSALTHYAYVNIYFQFTLFTFLLVK